MDEFMVGPKNLERGFIVDELTPAQQSNLAFLGQPLPSPFQGQPVAIVRGSERVFGPVAAAEAAGVAAAAPMAGDASAMAGQAVGAEEHDPRNIVNQDIEIPEVGLTDSEAEFAARVRQCWPRVMGSFMAMMQEPVQFEAGDYGSNDG
jgi:hypothetical protein